MPWYGMMSNLTDEQLNKIMMMMMVTINDTNKIQQER